jgi:adenylate cyclase
MAIEIERKFLVHGTAWKAGIAGVPYCQGYLNHDKQRTVRVRIAGNAAFLTIKGPSVGATRAEFEYPIPVADAQALLPLCDGPLIEKTRYVLQHAGTTWEVDEFGGANAGLVVAEVELTHEDQPFAKPDWLGEEVTHDARYFNSNLATVPFQVWGVGDEMGR